MLRNRRSGYGHHYSWKKTQGNILHASIHLPIPKEPQNRGLEGYGSRSSAPQTPQRLIPMKHGKQEVQPAFTLGRTWGRLPEDMSQTDTFKIPYGNHQRLESQ
ncbi:hypothetical protein O181_028099 [Austropuccinia psidii MF-1]|uniref:Uncharacterized protein n=1 Tax=Austropuccinia psidii MF-1 TaxID=1389203 RepID=A0A9Q3CN82_9BASI|nr:hypothetical protein [Austropuccinia psidii MF-1]